MIRVVLPTHLRQLAGISGELTLADAALTSCQNLLDWLETNYPALRGTIRDPRSGARRPFIRFFVCGEDWSDRSLETPLPPAVLSGAEPFYIVAAISGG